MRLTTRFRSLLCALALAGAPAAAAPHLLYPPSFDAFVVNWTPADRPLCAALRSEAEWARVMHPAPVMGHRGVFAPDAGFWSHHTVLLFARVVPMGDMSKTFHVETVSTARGVLTATLRTTPPPPASSRMKAWLGVVVVKPIPDEVRFVENGAPVCALDLRKGFVSPPLRP